MKARTPSEEPKGFKEALQQLEQSIFELRATSHNLYPDLLKREGLVEALRLFCEKIGNIASVDIGFEAIGKLPVLPADWELSLYRIVQELVQNIVKHSAARSAMVQLVTRDGLLTISVEDDGKGLPSDWKKKGMGLGRLENQLKAMHGSIEISTNSGTNVYMEFDLLKVNDEKPGN